jgi:hypothetical protein
MVKAPFKRLLQYPSVQRYLGIGSADNDGSDSKILIELANKEDD